MAALSHLRPVRHTERGVSLLFAMMTLVVLSLAAVALVRSVDLGALVVGNLGFKQDATAASAAGTAEAVGVLATLVAAGTTDVNDPASGYYATSIDKLDPTGGATNSGNKLAVVDWFGDGTCSYLAASEFSSCLTARPGTAVGKNSVSWIITRLCKKAEPMSAGNPCSKPATSSVSSASERGELSPGGRITAPTASPYYRIVVRTQGARNTVSFTESMVHF